jgi:hypothetical protein
MYVGKRQILQIQYTEKCHNNMKNGNFPKEIVFYVLEAYIHFYILFFGDIFSSFYFVSIMEPAIGVKKSCQT